jgi:16S rRNA (cytosine1407-C5)-methyltransferase
VDAVLKTFGSALQLDDISSTMPAGAQGIMRDREAVYSDQVRKSARLWPHVFGTAGFFAARFTRLDGRIGIPADEHSRGRPNRFEPLPNRQVDALVRQWQEQYDFGLAAILEKYQLVVVQFGKDLFAVPHWVAGPGSFLSYSSAGLPLAEQTAEGYLPAHDWMARFENSFQSMRYLLSDDQVDPWLRGSDIPGAPHGQFAPRQVVLVSDSRGRFLGLAKILKDRLKNLLPRRLAGGW